MSSEEDKPPAPPVRLTSNRGGSDRLDGPPDSKPLPKGNFWILCQWPHRFIDFYQPEPDDPDRKKKTLKNKIKSKQSHNDSKPNISYPTNFEHTVHVGFDAVTGEFTVSLTKDCLFYAMNKIFMEGITIENLVKSESVLEIWWFELFFLHSFVDWVRVSSERLPKRLQSQSRDKSHSFALISIC